MLVALKPDPEEFVTDSGLVLARDPDKFRTPTQGIVMALGEKIGTVNLEDVLSALLELQTKSEWPARDDAQMCCDAGPTMVRRADAEQAIQSLQPAPFDVEVGDCVLFSRGAGDALSADGVDYVVLFESEILCVLEPLKQHEAA